jgi:hypothetical protein
VREQVVGFVILVAGTIIYNELIHIPGLMPPKEADDSAMLVVSAVRLCCRCCCCGCCCCFLCVWLLHSVRSQRADELPLLVSQSLLDDGAKTPLIPAIDVMQTPTLGKATMNKQR